MFNYFLLENFGCTITALFLVTLDSSDPCLLCLLSDGSIVGVSTLPFKKIFDAVSSDPKLLTRAMQSLTFLRCVIPHGEPILLLMYNTPLSCLNTLLIDSSYILHSANLGTSLNLQYEHIYTFPLTNCIDAFILDNVNSHNETPSNSYAVVLCNESNIALINLSTNNVEVVFQDSNNIILEKVLLCRNIIDANAALNTTTLSVGTILFSVMGIEIVTNKKVEIKYLLLSNNNLNKLVTLSIRELEEDGHYGSVGLRSSETSSAWSFRCTQKKDFYFSTLSDSTLSVLCQMISGYCTPTSLVDRQDKIGFAIGNILSLTEIHTSFIHNILDLITSQRSIVSIASIIQCIFYTPLNSDINYFSQIMSVADVSHHRYIIL